MKRYLVVYCDCGKSFISPQTVKTRTCPWCKKRKTIEKMHTKSFASMDEAREHVSN